MRDTTSDVATDPIPVARDLLLREVRARRIPDTQAGARSDHSCYAGAGAFLSTPSDLVRFGMAVNNGKFLKPGTVQLLQTPQRLVSGKATGYGLGWMLDTRSAGGPTHTDGEPREPKALHRWLDVVPDVSRTRARRRRDGQHLVRGHEVDGAEHRAGVRRTGAKPGAPVMAPGAWFRADIPWRGPRMRSLPQPGAMNPSQARRPSAATPPAPWLRPHGR